MRGHQELLNLRRRGFVPAGGVVVDLGVIAYDWGTWAKKRKPAAFVRIELGEAADCRCLAALPVLLRVAPEATKEQTRAAVARIEAVAPKALGVVLMGPSGTQPDQDEFGRESVWTVTAGAWERGWPKGVNL
jgi:RNA 3'-terminal phosphate cyclase